MPDLSPLVEALLPLLKPALAAFLRTTVGMACMGVALAGTSFYLAAQGSWLRGGLVVLLVLAACVAAGLMLAMKRAVMSSLLAGVRRMELGRRSLGLLFARILGISEGDRHGERGGVVARTAERLPLAQAEEKLRVASRALLGVGGGSGLKARLSGALQRRLLALVEQVTLARFREEQQTAGGVDLVKVRDELSDLVDRALADRLEGAGKRVTYLVVAGCVIGSVALSMAIRQLPI